MRARIVTAGALSALILFGLLLKLRTSEGTLIVEVDDPKAIVQVLNEKDEVVIERKGEKGSMTIGVAPGKGRLRLVKDGVEVFGQDFSLVSGGKETIKARLEPKAETGNPIPNPESPIPPLAIAPFDAKKAKALQQACAKQLGVPVEITNSIGMKLVLIPPGEFEMGSPKELIEEELKRPDSDQWGREHLPGEGPQHRVRITRPFYLGTCLVTQQEYERVMGTNPSEFSATGKGKDYVAGQDTKRFPVECVSWDDAVEFCRKLSEMPEERSAGRGYRLPSEAQWEYACRAGSTGRYGFSLGGKAVPKEFEEHELSDYGWFYRNSAVMPHAVGLKRPSAWGLYDMHGNVWEWCQDWYDKDYYTKTSTDDPAGPSGGSYRVARGGGWGTIAWSCRSAFRDAFAPGYRCHDLGFRVSQVLADTAAERAKMSRVTETARPAAGSTAKKPSRVPPVPSPLAPIPPAVGSLVGADGKWKLPPGAPPPAVAPFDATKAKEYQKGWAEHLGVPVEISNSIGMKLVLIPPGEFQMGSPKELIEEDLRSVGGGDEWTKYHLPSQGPRHRVRITRPFYLGMYLVTQEEYQRVMNANPSEFSATGKRKDKVAQQETKRFPVETVSWQDADEFCSRLSEMAEEKSVGRRYRLPSEAQWEYACRAGSTGRRFFSPESTAALDEYAWFGGNSGGRPHAVGGRRASAWRLYDMYGNVWEHCQDWYDKDYYAKSATDDPLGPSGGFVRVFRGGCWDSGAWVCNSALRGVNRAEAGPSLLGPPRLPGFTGNGG